MSELDQAPISPSEAAQILSNSRWSSSDEQTPVSDGTDLLTGHRGVEASQNYEPMQPAYPVKQDAEALEPTEGKLREIATAIDERRSLEERIREGRSVDIERNYFQQGGPDAGKPSPANQTLSIEQSSADLTRARQQEATELERLESEQLAQTIDQLRAYDPTQQQAQPEQQAQPQIPQPEQTPQADDEVAKALQNPKVLAAVQEYTAQAQQQADAMANYYRQAVAQNAEAAAASIVSQWPELRGLNSQEQFRTAIQTVAATNPQRAQAMVAHIEQTRQIVGEQQRAASAHHQAEQQRARLYLDHANRAADNEFELWAGENLAEGQADAVKAEALAMLRETMTDDQINWQYNNNAMFRSFPAQKALAEASLYRISKRGAESKRARPVPVVQRPGSPEAREPEQDYHMRQLSGRLGTAKGNEALKIAAEMVQARRNARRR